MAMILHRAPIPDDLAEALLALGDPNIIPILDQDPVSPAIRKQIAGHPDAAIRYAMRRSAREWISKGSHVSLEMLESLTDETGPAAWTKLASDPDPQLRRAVAEAWFDAPEPIRRTLLTDPEPSVRAAACRRSAPPPSDLHALLIDHPSTRMFVAGDIALSEELAEQLAGDNDEDVRIAVAKNPTLPDIVRNKLAATGNPIIWANLICNQGTPEPLRARLHAEIIEAAEQPAPSWDIEFACAILTYDDVRWLRGLPLQDRLSYLDSPYAVFRRALANCEDLPDDAVARLQNDSDPGVLRTIARRPDTPADFLERVCKWGENLKYWPPLVDHPNFPKAAFARFADESEPRLRALACRDPMLPAAVVARLSRDQDVWVRRSAANHPNLPIEDLMRLLGDNNLDVVEAAAASPALPLEIMQRLARRRRWLW